MFAKLLGGVLGLAAVSVSSIAAAQPPPIFVGGQYIRQAAIEDDRGHLLVPVRGVFEAFGAVVAYTPPRIVVVRKNGAVIAGLIVGRHNAVVANRPRYLDAAPLRLAGRIYVPLRGIAEIAGASVHYSTKPRLVDIRLPNNDLAFALPGRPTAEIPPDPALPLWAYALVALIVLGFLIELGRRIAAISRRPPKAPLGGNVGPLALRPLQLPHAARTGNQNGIGKIAK